VSKHEKWQDHPKSQNSTNAHIVAKMESLTQGLGREIILTGPAGHNRKGTIMTEYTVAIKGLEAFQGNNDWHIYYGISQATIDGLREENKYWPVQVVILESGEIVVQAQTSITKGKEMKTYTIAIKGLLEGGTWNIYYNVDQTMVDAIQKDIADGIDQTTLIVLESTEQDVN
jgi:hypothetical protein